jgi:hypothetical protein
MASIGKAFSIPLFFGMFCGNTNCTRYFNEKNFFGWSRFMNRVVLIVILVGLVGCKSPNGPSSSSPNFPNAPTFVSEYENWPFGVTAGLATRYYQYGDSVTASLVPDKMASAGIRWDREDFEWSVLEPKKGKFNWVPFDDMVNKDLSGGVNVLGLLCYGAMWWHNPVNTKDMSVLTDTMLSEWSDYVKAVVGRYKNQIHYWEVWNEEDFAMFWYPTPNAADYVKLLRASYNAIISAAPGSHILMGGTLNTDTSFVSQVYANGGANYFDILALDLYGPAPDVIMPGDTMSPSMLVGQITRFHNLFPDKPLWITEIGWTTGVSYVSEDQQADYLVRAYSQLLAVPEIQKIFWYDFRNDATGDPYEDNFGLVNRDQTLSPKESYKGYQTLTNILGGATFAKEVRGPNVDSGNGFGDDVFEYRFVEGQKTIDILWTSEDSARTVVVDGIGGSSATLVSMTGANQNVNVQNGQYAVAVSQAPLYLIY